MYNNFFNVLSEINEIKFSWKSPSINVGFININDDPIKQANTLSNLGTACMNFIKQTPVFAEKFRIELRPKKKEGSIWTLNLNLDPVTWFDAAVSRSDNKVEKVEKILLLARKYVDNIRRSYVPQSIDDEYYNEEQSVPSKNYCCYHGECVKYKRECSRNSIKPTIFCRTQETARQKRSGRPCNWFAENERIISFDKRDPKEYEVPEDDEYIILSRAEDVREIIIFPLDHTTNSDLVVSNKFWLWVFKNTINNFLKPLCTKNEYPVECFALNFGKWESEEAADKYAKHCHGHLHLHLTLDLVGKLKISNNAMMGKFKNPKDYGFTNCQELETNRLMSLEISNMNKKINLLEKRLDSITEKLKDGFKEVEERIGGVEKRLEALESKITLIIKGLNLDNPQK